MLTPMQCLPTGSQWRFPQTLTPSPTCSALFKEGKKKYEKETERYYSSLEKLLTVSAKKKDQHLQEVLFLTVSFGEDCFCSVPVLWGKRFAFSLATHHVVCSERVAPGSGY